MSPARAGAAAALCGALLCLPAGAEEAAPAAGPEGMGYAVGVRAARDLQAQELRLDPEAVLRGMRDQLEGRPLRLGEEELRLHLRDAQRLMSQRRSQPRFAAGPEAEASSRRNREAGEAWLRREARRPGVVALPSGLLYEVVRPGDGPLPGDGDQVELRYRGTLEGGAEFSNWARAGARTTFRVAEAMPGWREALLKMPVGARWKLFLPPALAFGDKGFPPLVGPGSAVAFELELVAVKR